MPAGSVRIEATAPGFKTSAMHGAANDPNQPSDYGALALAVGETNSTVEVTAAAPMIETSQAQVSNTFSGTNGGFNANGLRGKNDDQNSRDAKKAQAQQLNGASSNVFELQRKVAGVLPVRVDVPRAGNSYRFARALVLDEETKVSFNYKTK